MEPPAMEDVYQAIGALYGNSNATDKVKASTWLETMQKSIHSWKISDDLLRERRDVKSCYFAAQTMRSKIKHSFFELPIEAHNSLRDSLISHLGLITPDTDSAILTQLSLALADLALQTTEWQNCVHDLIIKFSTHNKWALIEILTVLPQEVDSSSLKLGENRREEVKAELRANSGIINMVLKEIITSSPQTNIVGPKAIRCMTSWLQIKAINMEDISDNAVMGLSFSVLGDHTAHNTLHDIASDCVCALLQCIGDNNNNENIEKLIFDSVSSLENAYHLSVAHEEEEKVSNYARVFTELAESFLDKIIVTCENNRTHYAIKSLELVLVTVGYHDYEVPEISFNLWYRLSEELYQKDDQNLSNVFKPYIERLIAALCRHCQMDPDHSDLLDEGDEFYNFRIKVLELIKDVVFIIGSRNCFQQMFLALQGADISWEQTEAALFIMQAVAKSILPEEYEIVPKVVEAILAVPVTAHVAVRRTCVLLLGELCEWIDHHPECLEPCLQYLLQALQDPKLASASATALQNVCAACRRHMSGQVGGLLNLIRSLDSFALSSDAAIGLLRGVAATIGHLPSDQVNVAMREAVSIQLEQLQRLVKSSSQVNGPIRKGSQEDPVVWLDRLAALFRNVDAKPPENGHTHPCLDAFKDAWPIIAAILDKFGGEYRVMERGCRVGRFALRCVGGSAAPLLPHIASTLVSAYSAHPHSCALYLASILVDELASYPECVVVLVELLQTLMPKAFDLLQKPNGLKDNPDTVDDLFRFCVRFLQRAPQHFLQSPALPSVMECGIMACSLDHRDANGSVMKFFFDLLHMGHSRKSSDTIKGLVETTIGRYGEPLTNRLLHACVFDLHPYMIPEVAEVVLEVVGWQRRGGACWLQGALATLPQGVRAATHDQCRYFHSLALKAESNKEMTRILKDFVRLYR